MRGGLWALQWQHTQTQGLGGPLGAYGHEPSVPFPAELSVQQGQIMLPVHRGILLLPLISGAGPQHQDCDCQQKAQQSQLLTVNGTFILHHSLLAKASQIYNLLLLKPELLCLWLSQLLCAAGCFSWTRSAALLGVCGFVTGTAAMDCMCMCFHLTAELFSSASFSLAITFSWSLYFWC